MTIRGGGNPTPNMALEPRFRVGPPPRSLAAEAHGCIMVRPGRGPTGYSPPRRMAASWSGPVAGRPDTRLWRAGPRPGAGSPPIVILGHRPAACCRAAGWEVPQPLALDKRSPIQARARRRAAAAG